MSDENLLAGHTTTTIGTIGFVTDGPHGYHVVDYASPIAMLTASCVQDWFAERQGADPIAEWVDAANQRSALVENDLLLSTRGTIGHAALVTSETLPANIDQDVARIHITSKAYPSGYVLAFLNGRYGQDYFERHATGMVQQGLSLARVRLTPIPALSAPFRERIGFLVGLALIERRLTLGSLKHAEEALTRALALPVQSEPPLSFTRSARNALAAGRLDADYFSPAKQTMLSALGMLPSVPLGERFASIRRMFNPAEPGEITHVRDYDLPDALQPILDDSKAPEPVSAIGSVKKRLANDDVVISRLRAYLKEVAIVRAPEDLPLIGSSEFIVLRPKAASSSISPETLLAFLRSDPVQTILRYCQDGSHHPRFNEADLLAIPCPDVLATISPDITREVQAAFAARRRARALLDTAVRAVEIAIEASEAAALTSLEAAAGIISAKQGLLIG